MSELINNRAYRQKILKELISELHQGKTVDEVKQKFAETFQDVSAAEISEAEQALINDGLPVAEIQRLCDVHSAVFKGSIEEIHQAAAEQDRPGHPLHTFRLENRALEDLINESIKPHLQQWAQNNQLAALWQLKQDLSLLAEINLHYLKKENIFFPFMEKYGITAPPKVMWGVDDEIRAMIKEALGMINQNEATASVVQKIHETVTRINEMIFKEENILAPILVEHLTRDEWVQAGDDFAEIGYCLIEAIEPWVPSVTSEPRTTGGEAAAVNAGSPVASGATAAAGTQAALPSPDSDIVMPSGVFRRQELVSMLDTLPFDITFVDKDDRVRYFSQAEDRIFPRSKSIIGREVVNCHPPKSVHVVEKIVDDFKAGRKNHEDFWIRMGPRFVLIRYYAVRDEAGGYLGTVEVTQDIGPIRQIDGEKRLMDE